MKLETGAEVVLFFNCFYFMNFSSKMSEIMTNYQLDEPRDDFISRLFNIGHVKCVTTKTLNNILQRNRGRLVVKT